MAGSLRGIDLGLGCALRWIACASLLGACAVRGPERPTTHPADPAAPSGRLAGASASLRAGVVAYPDVPVLHEAPPPEHHHHAP